MLLSMMRPRQVFLTTLVLLGSASVLVILVLHSGDSIFGGKTSMSKVNTPTTGKPIYKPVGFPTPPVKDPFPLLATSLPPPIPSYNTPKKGLAKELGFDFHPPLLIGFTRAWPMLLQTVVSYITAGWPPQHIYVVENTGTHNANKDGRLTLQHPFYLNHTALARLGVHVYRTPVLLSFAQLQNFYLSLSYEHQFPYYFWSHMDVLALSHENGFENITPRATEPGYKTLYTLCMETLRHKLDSGEKWATVFFAYDHLTLTNPAAFEDIGGWDTLIPYYMTDCDTYSRLLMRNWSQTDENAGVITDTSTVLDDMLALYRDPTVEPKFTDPNPAQPTKEELLRMQMMDPLGPVEKAKAKVKRGQRPEQDHETLIAYWSRLLNVSDAMYHYKHGDRGRNTWQSGQHGGNGEPYHYDNDGITEAIRVLTAAGKEVFRRKWGHRDCDLLRGGGLKFDDQWRVERDWVE